MPLSNLIKELTEGVTERFLPATRAFGRGASAGLVKYPAALAAMGLDKAINEGKMTFQEAIDLINQRTQEERAAYPVTTSAAEFTGALIPAAKIAQTTRVLPAAAASAGFGGLAGFTEQENLRDAAVGAGLGAVLGPVAAKTSQLLPKANIFAAQQMTKRELNQAQKAYQGAVKEAAELTEAIANSKGTANTVPLQLRLSQLQDKELPELASNVVSAQMNKKFLGVPTSRGEAAEQSKYLLKSAGREIGENITNLSQSFTQPTLYALMGAGGGSLLGFDPLQSALVGAGASPFAGPIVRAKMGAAGMVPSSVARQTVAAATPSLSRITSATLPQETEQVAPAMGEISQPTEADLLFEKHFGKSK